MNNLDTVLQWLLNHTPKSKSLVKIKEITLGSYALAAGAWKTNITADIPSISGYTPVLAVPTCNSGYIDLYTVNYSAGDSSFNVNLHNLTSVAASCSIYVKVLYILTESWGGGLLKGSNLNAYSHPKGVVA